MRKIEKAHARHAAYYLKLYFDIAGRPQLGETDWRAYEDNLQNLRKAWEWLKNNKDLPAAKDLFFQYAELGWTLLELSHKHLIRITAKSIVKKQVKAKSDNVQEDIIQKLNNLLSSQERILNALPLNEIFGNRNVIIGRNAVKTSIYTGDISFNVFDMPDYCQAIDLAYKNKDFKLAGTLLFEKSKVLYKLGYLSEAGTTAKEALKILSQIKDANTINIEKQLLEWKETDS